MSFSILNGLQKYFFSSLKNSFFSLMCLIICSKDLILNLTNDVVKRIIKSIVLIKLDVDWLYISFIFF